MTSINSDQDELIPIPPYHGTSPKSSTGSIYKSVDGEDFERVEVGCVIMSTCNCLYGPPSPSLPCVVHLHYHVWSTFTTMCGPPSLPCMVHLHYHVWSTFTTMYGPPSLPCMVHLHYHVWSTFTTMYGPPSLPCMVHLHYHVWSTFTTMYGPPSLPCMVHLQPFFCYSLQLVTKR